MKAHFRLFFRFLRFVLHLLVGAGLCLAFFPRDSRKMKHFQWRIVQWWLRFCIHILGVRVEVRGERQTQPAPVCVVANHVSWVDILVLGSLYPVRFLSKVEVKKWFLVGYLASRAGTLYIKRGIGAREALKEMTNCFERGENVGLFPEGSTGRNSEVRRFYPRLFEAAVMTNAMVQPVSLAYPCAGKLHPAICFPKDESFVHNACKVMREKRIKVIVDLLEPLSVQEQEGRGQTAQKAQELVSRQTEHAYGRSS